MKLAAHKQCIFGSKGQEVRVALACCLKMMQASSQTVSVLRQKDCRMQCSGRTCGLLQSFTWVARARMRGLSRLSWVSCAVRNSGQKVGPTGFVCSFNWGACFGSRASRAYTFGPVNFARRSAALPATSSKFWCAYLKLHACVHRTPAQLLYLTYVRRVLFSIISTEAPKVHTRFFGPDFFKS